MKKLVLIILVLMFWLVFTNAFDFSIPGLADIFKSKVVALHFWNVGNNVKWFMVITYKKKLDTPVDIQVGVTTIKCNYQLRWYYYNPGHWEDKLYALDNATLSAWWGSVGYTMDGWLYVSCDSWDPNAVYGKITYKSWSTILYQLIAGTKYDSSTNDIDSQFADNLEYWTVPGVVMAGLIYDSMYGIWFVGGEVSVWFSQIIDSLNTQKVSEVFHSNFSNTIWASITIPFTSSADSSIAIEWLANLSSQSYKNFDTVNFQKNLLNQWWHQKVLSVKVVNISQIINRLRKNTNNLCRWKWQDIDEIDSSYVWKLVCIKPTFSVVNISSNLASSWKWTTIVVKWDWKKVVVQKSQTGNGYVNLFLDNWYVVFSNSMNLVKIDWNGNYNTHNYVTSGAYYKWDIMVNGIIAGADNAGNLSSFAHKLYIKGRLVSLNTIGDNMDRNDMITNTLWLDSTYVNLLKWFNWYCVDGTGSDGVNCSDPNDKYVFNSLILQSVRYNNPLIK